MNPPSETMPENSVLIVDDDLVILDSLAGYLRLEEWRVDCAPSGAEALEMMRAGGFGFVITDINMRGLSGIELLQQIKKRAPEIEVIIMTGKSTEEFAIQALKAGACDYFRKPIRGPEVSASLLRSRRVMALKNKNSQLGALVKRYAREESSHPFIGRAAASKTLQGQLERVAAVVGTTVLLTGESGVGKEVAARMIHHLSPNEDAPFVAINCGGISESLLERELFGHEKGAFTGADKRSPGVFEMALRGTVLLDEITEMTLSGQSRLLRVLQERTFRRVGGSVEVQLGETRVIAATNTDLEARVAEKLFREDLYFRLKVVPIRVPPLRERREDIMPLAEYYLGAAPKGAASAFSAEAAALLESYAYPGNVRELKNIVERAAIFCSAAEIGPPDLFFSELAVPHASQPPGPAGPADGGAAVKLADVEKNAILHALAQAEQNHRAAARALGITPQALYRRLEKHGIS